MKKTLIFTSIVSSLAISLLNFAPVSADDFDFTAVRPEILSIKFSDNGIVFDFDNFDLQTGTIEVTANSNAEFGYMVLVNCSDDSNNSLMHVNPLVTENVPSLVEDATAETFPTRGWGYSVDTIDRTFHKIPFESVKVFESTEPGDGIFDFTVGARSDANLPHGRYSNGLIFTVVSDFTGSDNL